MSKQKIMSLIRSVYQEPTKSSLTTKFIRVSRYKILSREIPDDFLAIQDVFPEKQLDLINERFAPYLKQDEIFVFLGTLGDNVFGVGYGNSNLGKIYYYDADFGIFELDATLEEFLAGLVSQEL